MAARRIAASLVLLHFFLVAAARSATVPPSARMVIVVSLDGFPAYALDDPKLPVPTLRHLMQTGAAAKQMQPINPTWTWPNHTTLVTGLYASEHGLLYNGALVRNDHPLSVKIDPSIPKTQMVRATTVYDLAHQAGLTTAQVDWVAINDAPTITWAFPEQAKPSDPFVREMVAKGLLHDEDVDRTHQATILWRDQIWTKAAAYLIREHKPNLLLFHLLSLDSTSHTYGPKTLASYDAMAFLDGCVKQLVDAVAETKMLDRTTFLVVSDHGFKSVDKQIGLRNLLQSAQLDGEVQAVPEGGSAMLYLPKNDTAMLTRKLRDVLSHTEGVERVVDPSEYPALGFPDPARDSQMPDLLAFAKAGYAFVRGTEGIAAIVAPGGHTIGAHGYPNTDPEMQAIFLASGYGIAKGVVLSQIQNTSVAPTLAELLGLKLPKSHSPALKEILQ